MLLLALLLPAPALLQLALAAPDPQDPPFDLSRALFSGAFSDHAVLQRAPKSSSVFGTATADATVTVLLTGPNGYSYTSAPAPVASSADAAVHGTWKVVLPPRPAGFGYTVEARCSGCSNATTATIEDVGFGEIWLCSG
eukprot:SAG11_NODE_3889_length_2165_cov_0.903679_1_plen_139_part_00